MISGKTNREKIWHNKRFKSGEDTREISKVRFVYMVIKYAKKRFNRLQNVSNLNILDIGCGQGIERALRFTKNNCQYTGIDISEECINSNKEKIKNLYQNISYHVDDANELKSVKNSPFDLIILSGTLHHLDIDKALDAMKRITRDERSQVIMWEPMGTNPIINLFRYFTPSLRTIDEKPLDFKDLNKIKKIFPNTTYELHSILSLLIVPIALINTKFSKVLTNILSEVLGRIDRLIGMIPIIKRMCWITIIKAR